MTHLLVTSRTRPESIARAASAGSPIPLRLSKRLSGADLLRILAEHQDAEYAEELAELLLSSSAANAALIRFALKRYPRSLGVKNAAALSAGASRSQLRRLTRSRQNSVRQHAMLSLLSDTLNRASERTFAKAVERAKSSEDPAAELYIIVVHPRTPRAVLQELGATGPDLVREEASRRLSKRNRRS